MGNPSPQRRANAMKPSLKPKHRHSGSASNISFTSEDAKPKHRHSGSVSNISFSSEDPKPKHRHSASGSNISLTPEDMKPTHRRSGSVCNSSTTPEDVQSRHRRNGSVSNNTNIEDFTSPSRDVSSPSSVSSSVSLKEKRLKRRTRSSLGGTEDFVKEIDFLTPSFNGRIADSSTRQEVVKPQSAPSSESEPSEAVPEARPHLPEASVPTNVKGIAESLPVGQANNGVVDVCETGCSPHDDKSSSGADRENPSSVEMATDEQQRSTLNEEGMPETQVDQQAALENAVGTSLASTPTEGSDSIEPGKFRTLIDPKIESGVDGERSPESQLSDAAVTTIPLATKDLKEFPESDISDQISEPSVTDATQALPESNGEVPRNQQGAKEMQEEKVSVQRRIEELEKIAGGRPVHFRSQSLSLPRLYDISHARHHEAEGSKGGKMPMYKAPLDGMSISEVGGMDFAGISQIDETVSKETDFAPGPTESSAQIEEERSSSQSTRSLSDHTSNQTGPQVGPKTSETVTVADTSLDSAVNGLHPDSLVNGLHPENVITVGSSQSLPDDRAESMEGIQIPEEIERHSTTAEHNLVETEEAGLEAGLGEAYVMVSGAPAPEVLGIPKELSGEPSSHPKKDKGANCESVEAEVLVEPPPGAQRGGAALEAELTGKVPEQAKARSMAASNQRSTMPELPSVPTSAGEQSSQDFETSILLSKKPAVDPLFIDSQQDRLWEMHSQELTIEESSGQEVRESSAQDDDPRPYANETPTHAEVAPACSTANGPQSDKSGKVDRPRTPLRSLLAEEDAEKSADSGQAVTPPQNQTGSPRGNLFKRIVSGAKNSPTKQMTPSKFSPKNQPAAKPFLSSCMCCSVK